MEEEIQERLDKDYRNISILVEFVEFRKYKIIVSFYGLEDMYDNFVYTYDMHFTFDYNMSIIEYKINQIIRDFFYHKEGGNYNVR